MPEKQTQQQRLKEITDSIEQGIRDLFASDKYTKYLRTTSRFHRYSVNNQILIFTQRPDATLVAGFSRWRDQFGRTVKKGEKGIRILAPTPFTKTVEEPKLDPDTRLPLLDEQGREIIEEKTIRIPRFKVVTVFNVDQTEGKPLPEIVSDLKDSVNNYEVFMEAIKRSSPVPISVESLPDNSDGYFSLTDQRIVIRDGMSQAQTVSAVIHEIAHAKLHNPREQKADEDGTVMTKDRRTEEVEAESISYSCCQYYGIETSENSFGYIATWSKDKELKELRESLETINKTASELISDIDYHFAEIQKERENLNIAESTGIGTPNEAPVAITPPVEEAISIPEIVPLPDPSVSIASMNAFGYTDTDMLPLSRERALELMERDVPVYMLYDNNTAAMAFDAEDIRLYSGFFGVTRDDWETVKADIPPMSEEVIVQKREQTFLDSREDAYAIYQLKDDSDFTATLRFMNMDWLEKHGVTPQHGNYDLVYTGKLTETGDQTEILESLYRTFNTDHPADFTGHSLSVSDIVALKQDGVVSYHYVDSIGYRELPDFNREVNPLKNAEMQVEDDLGMIDGIINNGTKQVQEKPDRPQPSSMEKKTPPKTKSKAKPKKPSILAQIRQYQEEDRQQAMQRKCAERDF